MPSRLPKSIAMPSWPRRSEPDLRKDLADRHAAVPGNVNTWAMQSSSAAKGDWVGMMAYAEKSEPRKHEPKPEAATAHRGRHDPCGIGPKASQALAAAGITTYAALASANEPSSARHSTMLTWSRPATSQLGRCRQRTPSRAIGPASPSTTRTGASQSRTLLAKTPGAGRPAGRPDQAFRYWTPHRDAAQRERHNDLRAAPPRERRGAARQPRRRRGTATVGLGHLANPGGICRQGRLDGPGHVQPIAEELIADQGKRCDNSSPAPLSRRRAFLG